MSAVIDSTASAPQATPAASVAARGWRTEDWVAVLIGFVVIAGIIASFHWKMFDVSTIVASHRWTTDTQLAGLAPEWIEKLDGVTRDAEARGQADVAALSKALRAALEKKDRKAIQAAAGKMAKLGSKSLAGALGAAGMQPPTRRAASSPGTTSRGFFTSASAS